MAEVFSNEDSGGYTRMHHPDTDSEGYLRVNHTTETIFMNDEDNGGLHSVTGSDGYARIASNDATLRPPNNSATQGPPDSGGGPLNNGEGPPNNGDGPPTNNVAVQEPPNNSARLLPLNNCVQEAKKSWIILSILTIIIISFAVLAFISLILAGHSLAQTNELSGEEVENLKMSMDKFIIALHSVGKQQNDSQAAMQEALNWMETRANMTMTAVEYLTSHLSLLQTYLTDNIEGQINYTSLKITELTSRLANLENSLNSSSGLQNLKLNLSVLQSSVSVLQNNVASLTAEQRTTVNNLSTVNLTLDTRLNATEVNLSALLNRSTVLERTVNSVGIQGNATHEKLIMLQNGISAIKEQLATVTNNTTSLQRNLNQFQTALNATLTNTVITLRQINATIKSNVGLYSRCYKDVASCTVIQHDNNPHWYVCITPFRAINVTVCYIMYSSVCTLQHMIACYND